MLIRVGQPPWRIIFSRPNLRRKEKRQDKYHTRRGLPDRSRERKCTDRLRNTLSGTRARTQEYVWLWPDRPWSASAARDPASDALSLTPLRGLVFLRGAGQPRNGSAVRAETVRRPSLAGEQEPRRVGDRLWVRLRPSQRCPRSKHHSGVFPLSTELRCAISKFIRPRWYDLTDQGAVKEKLPATKCNDGFSGRRWSDKSFYRIIIFHVRGEF